VPLNVNVPTLAVTIALFSIALWGTSLILGSVGLMVRSANLLSNILYPILLPLSGAMFPLDRMPDWLRIPARCLPFGYGIDAFYAALSRDASLGDVRDSLVPLALFAVALPVIGVAMFRVMDRAVRRIGTLDIA
jgi:ABC-type multidrug transport system permease subunit